MATLIQFRRGTASQWTSANTVLHAGELGFETNTGKFKLGDGTTAWVDLSYASVLPSTLDNYVLTSALGANSGVATLDSNGKLPVSQLPDLAKVTVHSVANQTARLALTVEPGDIAIQTDTGDTYVLAASPASSNGNWAKITVGDQFPSHTTDDLTEGSTNLYYTSTRARNDVAADIASAVSGAALGSTDDLSEGTTNLYFTAQRAINATASSYDPYGSAASAQSSAATYTDGKISTEVTNRNTAITAAISSEVTNRNTAITSAISSEVTNRNNAITSAISSEVTARNSAIGTSLSTAEGYTDTAISGEVTNRNNAITSAISSEVTARNSAIATAKGEAISSAATYTNSAITNLVNGAPAVLDTLKELADAIADDKNFATTVATNISNAKTDAEGYTDSAISTEVTNRNNAITSAVSSEVTNRNNAITAAISSEVTARNNAISSAISSEVTARNSAISDAVSSVETYVDSAILGAALGSTDDLSEGLTNLYFTTQRAFDAVGNNLELSGGLYVANDGKLAVDGYYVTFNGASQTLSNKTISGSSNTLTNIGNSSLTNSKVTINTKDVSLGGSLTLGTNDVAEGSTNLYYTDNRAKDSAVSAISAGTGVTKTTGSHSATFSIGQAVGTTSDVTFSTVTANLTGNVTGNVTGTVSSLSNHNSDDVSEGTTNKYYTSERAQDDVFNAVSSGTGISTSYNDSGNTFTITNTGVTSLAGTTSQITVSASTGGVTLSLPNSVVLPGDLEVNGNTIIDGDLQVKGTTTTVNTQTVSVQDNLIYLNASLSMAITGATHNTTTVEYKVADNSQIVTGMAVRVTDVTPSNYNIASSDNVTVLSKRSQGNNHYFTVTKTVSVTYTSGGTAEFKTNADPDLGLAGGYYEAGYAHAGLFRDASDSGIWKFFQGYTPEPDAATTIDTTDASFAFASLQAADFRGSGAYLTSIPNSALVNSTISGKSLGSNLSNLTIGTGLSGSSYNGSTAVTIAIDSTVATLSGAQTLTNKSISGSSNTITNLPNSSLTNSSITINGVSFSLGDSKTISSTSPNALTIGTGLTGTSYDGSSAVTVAIDSTVATLSGAQTLTNKTISGSSNTLSNIANSSLTNSKVTVGTTDISLGASATTLAGLTSVTSTSFVGALTGNASTVTNGVYTTDTGTVTNTMLAGSIADSKLSTISTAGKVANSATTATSSNTASAIVARDSSGNFTAGTITAALSGNASTATKLAATKNINGVAFDGSADITVTAAAGTLTGTTLNSSVVTSSLTSVGTLASLTTAGDVNVGGALVVTGNLTVNGTTETVNSTTVTVADKNIELGSVATPTDTTANGGGITLKGATDKTINWVSATTSWTSSENFDIASGKTYKVAGTTVLSATQVLGKTIGGTTSGDIADINTAQTLTNKTISGSSNTLSNIGNSSLTNSKVTVGSTDIALGASATTIAGLSSVSSTSFTGALTGNADTATKLATARAINGVNFDGSAAITVTADASTLTGTTLNSSVVTSSLTAVGTIATGTWSATTIALNKGGTGATTQAGAANAVLPSQTSASGKYLTSDGTNVSWGTVNALPTQSGNSGKYLTTDGTNASWAAIVTDPLPQVMMLAGM